MICCKILYILLVFTTLSLSSSLSCSISTSFIGLWIQPGLIDLLTINNTWFSLKGTCLSSQQDVKNKYIYYNEQTRCKRCIFFIPRHLNALQYRESECFDADDDNGRICGSITPDTVLYTLFRDNAESIPCPFDQSWYFKKDHQICQPKAFHNCFSTNTFQILYNNLCQYNNHHFKIDIIATCFAQFSDGNMNYILSRSVNQEKFICFSYTKIKMNENISLPNEVYFSEDETCRNLLTRESVLILNILPNKLFKTKSIPEWIQGTWLSIGTTDTFHINKTQFIMKINNNFKSLTILQSKQQYENSIYIRAKSLEQCSSIFYCIKLIYRSSAVIDLSIGRIHSDQHECKDSPIHYTLFKSVTKSDSSCPQNGIYKSLNTYRSSLPISTCSIGLWTLSIGCEITNKSELILSSSCRHEIVPDVQVITSVKGICLASWRTDHRFQRTIVLYEKNKAFCLIQPLKSQTASWIFSEMSCTTIDLSSIHVENSFHYSDTCQTSSSSSNIYFSYLLFYLAMQVLIYM